MTAELVHEPGGAAIAVAHATTDWPAVLTYLGLNPANPETKALVLLCDRYGLDPLLGHARIIGSSGGFTPYITRDGMLEIAHRSGQLDGIVVDELRRNSTGDGWTAYVSVWRKDMSHPFRYGAQCRDNERQGKQGYAPEQALARAERRALKRAFSIAGAADDIADDEPREPVASDDGSAVGGVGSTAELPPARGSSSAPPVSDADEATD